MKGKGLFCAILAVFLALNSVSANSYIVEYTQVENKLVVKETVDNIQISNQVSAETLEKSSEGYYFVKKLIFNDSYSEAEIILNLDTRFIIKGDGVFPSVYETQSDGQIISVVWKLSNVKPGDIFPMFVKIKDTYKNDNYVLLLVISLLIILIVYLIYKNKSRRLIVRRSSKKAKKIQSENRKESDYLLDTEKRVIEELKKADRNELWQKQIQAASGYSKAKVSRLVRNLEARGLVVKIPFGNTNKIRLK